MIKIIECPRDAMQGIHTFIPTAEKISYLNALLKVGFDTLDFGSFVSPKAIPQLRDTVELIDKLAWGDSQTELLAIVANIRGAEDACSYSAVKYVGYPFSISETFQQRNTNRGITEAFEDVKRIQEICALNRKKPVIYISMGFGNPYGDPWNAEIAMEWVDKLSKEGIRIFSLSDTVGAAEEKDVSYLFNELIPAYPQLEFGAHFHSAPAKQLTKIRAAYQANCRRFDSALLGFGGCPMAEDELVGNTATEVLISFLTMENEDLRINSSALQEAMDIAARLFATYL